MIMFFQKTYHDGTCSVHVDSTHRSYHGHVDSPVCSSRPVRYTLGEMLDELYEIKISAILFVKKCKKYKNNIDT